MSKPIRITILCEGQTEEKFVKELLAPYFLRRNIFITPIVLSKKGQKGGDVKFSRAERDIVNSLRQSNVSAVSTFVDYYGVKEWPGKDNVLPNSPPDQIADCLNHAAKDAICSKYDKLNPQNRFIPFVAVHEFEALLFSDSKILAEHLHIEQAKVDEVLSEHDGLPEKINSSPATAPSKRLEQWDARYGKTTAGIAIASAIGIEKMREKCPLFDTWLCAIERKAEE